MGGLRIVCPHNSHPSAEDHSIRLERASETRPSRGNQRYFAGLPASFGEHSSTVGTDVFRYGVFASPRLFQVREVDLNWQRLAPLNSRIETLQTRNLPLRTVIISLLVLDGRDSFWRFHGLPPALVLKATRGDTAWKPKLPSLGCPRPL